MTSLPNNQAGFRVYNYKLVQKNNGVLGNAFLTIFGWARQLQLTHLVRAEDGETFVALEKARNVIDPVTGQETARTFPVGYLDDEKADLINQVCNGLYAAAKARPAVSRITPVPVGGHILPASNEIAPTYIDDTTPVGDESAPF